MIIDNGDWMSREDKHWENGNGIFYSLKSTLTCITLSLYL